jgi:hypothetical protein
MKFFFLGDFFFFSWWNAKVKGRWSNTFKFTSVLPLLEDASPEAQSINNNPDNQHNTTNITGTESRYI